MSGIAPSSPSLCVVSIVGVYIYVCIDVGYSVSGGYIFREGAYQSGSPPPPVSWLSVSVGVVIFRVGWPTRVVAPPPPSVMVVTHAG